MNLSALKNDDALEKIEVNSESELKLYLKKNKSLSGLLKKAASNFNITSVKTEQISLHEIFISMVKNDEAKNYE